MKYQSSRGPAAPLGRIGMGIMLAACMTSTGCESPQSAQAETRTNADPVPSSPGAPAARAVGTVRPERSPLKRVAVHPAHVEPYEKADIYAKASGYLEAIHVDIGDRVEKGRVLAELRIPEMAVQRKQKQAAIDQAEAQRAQSEASVEVARAGVESARAQMAEITASVKRYEADLERWRSELNRTQQLVSRGAATASLLDEIRAKFHAAEAGQAEVQAQVKSAEAAVSQSRAELDKARSDVSAAATRVEVAKADLEHLETLIGYAKVEAPFDGVVTRRLVDTGAFILSAETRAADPVVTLMRVDRKRIIVDIPESEAGWIELGQPATFRYSTVGGKRELPGKVTRFTDALDPGTRTMRTEVELDEPEEIRPGVFGEVSINLADYPEAVTVPSEALLAGGEAPAVMVVEDGRARRREVRVGIDDGVRAQILSGLVGHEQVIVEGKNAVREGQPVRGSG